MKAFLFCIVSPGISQETHRYQYPPGLKNAYFGLSIGYINYPFANSHLEKGFTAEKIEVPHTAVRFILYGRPINKFLSAQVTYMRPVTFARYKNVNGEQLSHNVWMTVGGITFNLEVPLHEKILFQSEAGLGVVTRKGFSVNGVTALTDVSYASFLFGGSLNFRLNRKWDLKLSGVMSPAHEKAKQPHTVFFSAGFNYHLKELPKETIERNVKANYQTPRQTIYFSYSSNILGYGVNDAVSKGPVPIFWGGEAHVRRGYGLHYQRNIFHARKVFAFDWGVGIGGWESRDLRQSFFTASLYPVLKFNAIRSRKMDLFLEYSVAGPTYISKRSIDHKKLGKEFTFQDFMGMGVFAGKNRKLMAGLRIAHFSNGNIFTNNEGVKVPLTLNLGLTL